MFATWICYLGTASVVWVQYDFNYKILQMPQNKDWNELPVVKIQADRTCHTGPILRDQAIFFNHYRQALSFMDRCRVLRYPKAAAMWFASDNPPLATRQWYSVVSFNFKILILFLLKFALVSFMWDAVVQAIGELPFTGRFQIPRLKNRSFPSIFCCLQCSEFCGRSAVICPGGN